MEKLKEILLKFFNLDSLVENLNGYLESRVALVKMEIREEVASVLSRGFIILIMFLTAFLFVIFLSMGLAEYLNAVLGDGYLGYMAVGGFYGLVLLLMIAFRKALLRSFEKKFYGLIRNKEEE